MSTKTSCQLFRALLELKDVRYLKAARGTRRTSYRHLGSCGIWADRRSSLQFCPPVSTPHRSFISLAAPSITRRMEYAESRTLDYTPEQMYNVVANVDEYQKFVPWCKKSQMTKRPNGDIWAQLEIGFPPISERYTSEITFVPNHKIRAVCSDGSLFSHLETTWRFAPGAKDLPGSCKVDFVVSFEFKSLLHSQLASLFFDEVVKKMVSAFESHAAMLYRNQPDAAVRKRPASNSPL